MELEENGETKKVTKYLPITEETQCGFGPIRGAILQRLATKNICIFLYGLIGLLNSAGWAYFNGTITTMEKRFKIPSKVMGSISLGVDVSQVLGTIILSYWAGKGHRPRWMAFGLCTTILNWLLNALPHAIYGPGEDALALTLEYGGNFTNFTLYMQEKANTLCQDVVQCDEHLGSFAQPAILFFAQFIGGAGGALFYTIGITYVDDNVPKEESPLLISISYFLRMVGPALGYAIASFCLKWYIVPGLTPIIKENDPRWLGAWWSGWLMLAAGLTLLNMMFVLFPKKLPSTARRQALRKVEQNEDDVSPSFRDLLKTMLRLTKNKIFMNNNLATIFYILGEYPYWTFLSKYFETQYKRSASDANFATGTVGLVCSACGILLSGTIISKFKPTARQLATWNVTVGFIMIIGTISYIFVTCNNTSTPFTNTLSSTTECNADCDCEYASYAPVCSEENQNFISACHAGCHDTNKINGDQIFFNCSCIKSLATGHYGGFAKPGLCPTDCNTPFYIFLTILCLLKLSGATGISSNFLVGVRCIDEKDKSASLGYSVTVFGLFSFATAPVLYGFIFDSACLVWGKTCSGTGNCWFYDSKKLTYTMNLTAAGFLSIGTMFDAAVWYYSKNLKIFD